MKNLLSLICMLLMTILSLSAQNFKKVTMPFNDIAYNKVKNELYGSLPGTESNGNAVLVLNPESLSILRRIPVGSEPTLLKVTDDGRFLYVVLSGSMYLKKIDLETYTIVATLPLESFIFSGDTIVGALTIKDLILFPDGNGGIVSRMEQGGNQVHSVAAFDGTEFRPDIPFTGQMAGNALTPGATPQYVWGWGHASEPQALTKYEISASGVNLLNTYPGVVVYESRGVSYEGTKVYLANGQIIDVASGEPVILHTFNNAQNFSNWDSPMAPAPDESLIYQLSNYNPGFGGWLDLTEYKLKIYDKQTYTLLNTHSIPFIDVFDKPFRIIPIGQGRLVMLLKNNGLNNLYVYHSTNCPPVNIQLKITAPKGLGACPNDTIILIADDGYSGYLWSDGSTSREIAFSAPESTSKYFSYRVVFPDGCLSNSSDSVEVITYLPPFNFSVGNSSPLLCPDRPEFMYASSSNAAKYISSSGDTTYNGIFKVQQPGLIGAYPISPNGCPGEMKWTEFFELHPEGKIKPAIKIDGSLTFCSSETLTLTAPDGAFGYEWSNNSTSKQIMPENSGEYAVRTVYQDGCNSVWSDTLKVVVRPSPVELSIQQVQDNISVYNWWNINDSLVWRINGQILQGFQNTAINSPQNGFYQVENHLGKCVTVNSLPFLYPQTLSVQIAFFHTAGLLHLEATTFPNPGAYTYTWSDGSSTPVISVNTPGQYCVTATRIFDGATASTCISVEENNKYQIQVNDDLSEAIGGLDVYAYEWTQNMITRVDTAVSNSDGTVLFKDMASGNYVFRASPPPNTTNADLYLPTYGQSFPIWTSANVYDLSGLKVVGIPPKSTTITLLTKEMLNGNGTVSGFVNQIDQFFQSGNTAGTAPYSGVEIWLFDSNWNPIAFTVTNDDGIYSFSNLLPGIYFIGINHPGSPFYYQVVYINDGTQNPQISFSFKNGAFYTSVNEYKTEPVKVFPNPFDNKLSVKTETAIKNVTLINSLGRQVNTPMDILVNQAMLLTDNLDSGFYVLRITMQNGQVFHRTLIRHQSKY